MVRVRGPRVALAIVAAVSRLVPAAERPAWRLEWEGELWGRWHELAERGALTWVARLDLVMRAASSFFDAMSYGVGRWTVMGWWHDVTIAARSLRRRPAFALMVVGTLAIGVGASSTIFGVAQDVLLRPFPYPEADKVVALQGFDVTRTGFSGNVTYPNVADLIEGTTSFEQIGLARYWSPALQDDRGSVVIRGATVTANFFDVLGMEPGVGRFFRPDEQGEGRENRVVLSHSVWAARFEADSAIVGSDIRLNDVAYLVIGVTPEGFEDPWLMGGPGAEPQMWRTVASPPSEWPRSGRSWKGIARVRSDVTMAAAQAELDVVFSGIVTEFPEHNANRVMRITPIREVVAGPARPVLLTLLASVMALLLIACANVANLLLGRALDRENEFALHRALGAPAWRVMNRCLAESFILAGMGGASGIVLAMWLSAASRSLSPMLPRPVTGSVDLGVLGFALAVTVGSGLLFGLAPAFHSARSGTALPGRDGGRGATGGRRGNRLRRALVIGEVALTAMLLVGSGLLARSFQHLGGVELGLETEGVVGIGLHGSAWAALEPDEAQAQWDEVLVAVRSVPGVQTAGAIDYLPLGGNYSCDGVLRIDQPLPAPGEGRCAEVRVVLPGALPTMGVELVRGRLLDASDHGDSPLAVVIDETLASSFWPGVGEDPIGARIHVHNQVHEVVGVVRDMLHFGPGQVRRPMLYLHAPQEGWNGIARGLILVVRGGFANDVVPEVRRAVQGVNASIAIGDVETLDGLLRRNLAGPRFRTALMATFAATALLLALLGIAGVMSYSVSRRTRELGVRLALGARPTEVRDMVLKEGFVLIAAGVAIGLSGALGVAGMLDAMLFEVTARDPWVYATVTFVLVSAAAAACYVPAHRASRVDPVVAMSSD